MSKGKNFFGKLSEALGGGGDFASEYEDHGYNGHARPTAGEASTARRSSKANAKLSDEEAAQLTTGKHFWDFFDLEFERNEAFQKHVLDVAHETGAIDAYNPDPLNSMDIFWAIGDKAHTRYADKFDAEDAQIEIGKDPDDIEEQIWHVDEDGNPTTMATTAEAKAYKNALRQARRAERERQRKASEAAKGEDDEE